MPKETEELMTVQAVVDYLGQRGIKLSEQTIRNWIRAKKIEGRRPGFRTWYVPRREAERIVDQGLGDSFDALPASLRPAA